MGRLDDVRPVLAASDFFVLCSEREGMSNALLEAMQAGCVPVVTSAGDNERIVRHGESGVVASPEGIGEAVLSAHRDRAGFNRYRCAAIESVAQYSTAAMVNNTLRLYKQLAAGQSAAMEYATS
jgi:glycosyltransferase involved in cell wall biosynthesis